MISIPFGVRVDFGVKVGILLESQALFHWLSTTLVETSLWELKIVTIVQKFDELITSV